MLPGDTPMTEADWEALTRAEQDAARAEQVADHDRRINDLEGDYADLEQRVCDLERENSNLTERVINLEGDLYALVRRVDDLLD